MTLTDPPQTGIPQRLASGVTCVLAPNPSPMTHWGTNTYLLGHDRLMIVDPGPALPAHFEAMLAAIAGRPVHYIVITHSHIDHSALAPALAAATGAVTVGFGAAGTGRSTVMAQLATGGLIGGGEGIDHSFRPDRTVADGAIIDDGETALAVLHTPGHLGNHICLQLPGLLFSGDHLMGWASSLVSPPDGDLSDFMASCARLLEHLPPGITALPGHGAPVPDVVARIGAIMTHRLERETQIVRALKQAPGTAAELACRIYTDTPAALMPAATRNVLAHLIDLKTRNLATCPHPLTATSRYSPM